MGRLRCKPYSHFEETIATLPDGTKYISTLCYHAAAERLLGIIDDESFPHNTKRAIFSLDVAPVHLTMSHVSGKGLATDSSSEVVGSDQSAEVDATDLRAEVVDTESFVMCMVVDEVGHVLTGNSQGFIQVVTARTRHTHTHAHTHACTKDPLHTISQSVRQQACSFERNSYSTH
jgi:hypothetical protein